MSHVFESAFYHVSFCRDSSGGIPAGMGAHLILVVQDALLVLGMLWIYDAQEALQAKMALVGSHTLLSLVGLRSMRGGLGALLVFLACLAAVALMVLVEMALVVGGYVPACSFLIVVQAVHSNLRQCHETHYGDSYHFCCHICCCPSHR